MGHRAALAFTILACAGALSLAGCGKRGPLELPDGAVPTPQAAAAEQARQDRSLQNVDQPGLIQSPDQYYEQATAAKLKAQEAAPSRPINAPHRVKPDSFVLDPLL